MVTAGTNINGWGLSPEDRVLWRSITEHSLIELQKSLCEKCQRISFERLLDYTDWESDHMPQIGFRRPTNDTQSEDDPGCGLCSFFNTGRDEFVLIVLPSLLGSPHGLESGTALAVVELATYWDRIYAMGMLPSTKLGWASNANVIEFDEFREKLALCKESHVECQQVTHQNVAQLNVIDCQTRQIIPAPAHCDYIALSYVWGTPENTSTHQGSLLPTKLDATIEDALVVTQRLGLRYIWIDRYCISPDDKDGELRKTQIQNMHLVYSQAQLSIIAAAGDDVTFGLPGVSEKPRITQDNALVGPCIISSLPYTSERLLRSSKWMTRAWTFQEAVFSRRRLIFTQERLFLQCRNTESADGTRSRRVRLGAKNKPALASPWKPSISFGADDGIEGLVRGIEQYSQRDLTYEYDALRGFQGVLSAYESRGIPHHWGIPSLNLHLHPLDDRNESPRRDSVDGFVFGLCWRPQNLCKRRSMFPTWSWTGWKGSIAYNWFNNREALMKSTDVEVSVEFADGEQLSWIRFVQISDKVAIPATLTTFIWITAWCIPLTLEKTRHDEYCSAIAVTTRGDKISWGAGIMESQRSEDDSIYAEKKKGMHTGVLLAPREVARKGHYYPYVLIVEHKVDRAERIAFFVINGYSMGISSDSEGTNDPNIIELLHWERRSIRLG